MNEPRYQVFMCIEVPVLSDDEPEVTVIGALTEVMRRSPACDLDDTQRARIAEWFASRYGAKT